MVTMIILEKKSVKIYSYLYIICIIYTSWPQEVPEPQLENHSDPTASRTETGNSFTKDRKFLPSTDSSVFV